MDQLKGKNIISFFNSALVEWSFKYKNRALHFKKIEGSHTGFNKHKGDFESWGIPMDRIYVFLRENAFNMKAGINMLESFQHLVSFAHIN